MTALGRRLRPAHLLVLLALPAGAVAQVPRTTSLADSVRIDIYFSARYSDSPDERRLLDLIARVSRPVAYTTPRAMSYNELIFDRYHISEGALAVEAKRQLPGLVNYLRGRIATMSGVAVQTDLIPAGIRLLLPAIPPQAAWRSNRGSAAMFVPQVYRRSGSLQSRRESVLTPAPDEVMPFAGPASRSPARAVHFTFAPGDAMVVRATLDSLSRVLSYRVNHSFEYQFAIPASAPSDVPAPILTPSLTDSLAMVFRDARGAARTVPLLILETAWSTDSVARASCAGFALLLARVRLDWGVPSPRDSVCGYTYTDPPPALIHSAQVLQAIAPLQRVAPSAVSVIFLPMGRYQGAEPLLRELFRVDREILARSQALITASEQTTLPPDVAGCGFNKYKPASFPACAASLRDTIMSAQAAEDARADANVLPVAWDVGTPSHRYHSATLLLASLLNVMSWYGQVAQLGTVVSVSWITDVMRNPFDGPPTRPANVLLVAAAGNDSLTVTDDRSLRYFAALSARREVLAAVNLDDAGRLACSSSVVDTMPAILAGETAAGYDGSIAAACGTSFAAPRLAWFAAAAESLRPTRYNSGTWVSQMSQRFTSQRGTLLPSLRHIAIDPVRLLREAASGGATPPVHQTPAPPAAQERDSPSGGTMSRIACSRSGVSRFVHAGRTATRAVCLALTPLLLRAQPAHPGNVVTAAALRRACLALFDAQPASSAKLTALCSASVAEYRTFPYATLTPADFSAFDSLVAAYSASDWEAAKARQHPSESGLIDEPGSAGLVGVGAGLPSESAVLWGLAQFLADRARAQANVYLLSRFVRTVCTGDAEPVLVQSCRLLTDEQSRFEALRRPEALRLAARNDVAALPTTVVDLVLKSDPAVLTRHGDEILIARQVVHTALRLSRGGTLQDAIGDVSDIAAFLGTGVPLIREQAPAATSLYLAGLLVASVGQPFGDLKVTFAGKEKLAWLYAKKAFAINLALGRPMAAPRAGTSTVLDCSKDKGAGTNCAPWLVDRWQTTLTDAVKTASVFQTDFRAAQADKERRTVILKYAADMTRSLEALANVDPASATAVRLRSTIAASQVIVNALAQDSHSAILVGVLALPDSLGVTFTLPATALRGLTLAAAVADATSASDVASVLESFVQGSRTFADKRSAANGVFVTLNAYVGAAAGWEKLSATSNTTHPGGWFGAAYAPIGLEFGWPLCTSFLGLFRSASVFVQAIDLGALTSWRLENTSDVNREPEVHFAQVLAPGLHVVLGFRDVPLSLGLGTSASPRLRRVTGDLSPKNATRVPSVFLAMDIPLFP